MKKQLLLSSALLLGAALSATAAQRGGNSVTLSGVEFSVDTLFHAKVGPGTTQTSLHLINKTNTSQQLRVFYLTTDLAEPNTSIEAIVAQDKVAGGATVSNMAKSHKTDAKNYFCGVNTDFFLTSGTASNGKSVVGAPVRASIAGGEIYRTGDADTTWPNVYIDNDGKPQIEAVSFRSGTVTVGGATAELTAINNDAYDNGIAIYTPKYYGTPSQPGLNGSCVTIPVKIADGDYLGAGRTVKFTVSGEASTAGDREMSGDEYLLLSRGTANSMLNGLKVGDEVTVYVKATVDGTEVFPRELACANPRILRDGVTLDSEDERGDASARHPRTGIGFNHDKTMMVMMVIDGRSAISAGVHTKELADMLYYAGADDAANVDGGGSSTLYTQALGVRNKTSDGNERAVASGMFVVANVPDDDAIAELRFVEWSMKCPKYGIYTPKFFGYNKYGVLVDNEVQGVTLSCDSNIGEIVNDGVTFYATGSGIGALKATYNGIEASIPVVVAESDDVAIRLDKILIDNKREYPIEVQAVVNESNMPINPKALSWTSADESVATVGESDGVLRGVADGQAVIIGTVGSFIGTTLVTVEIPTGEVMPVDADPNMDEWTTKMVGGTDLTMTAFENGMKFNYTGNGTSRGAYLQAEKSCKVWSLPEKLRVRINPGDVTVKKVSSTVSDAYGNVYTSWAYTTTELPKNTLSTFDIDLSENIDLTDIGVYPITVNTLRLDLGASAKNTAFEIQVPGFEAVYSNGDGSVSSVTLDGVNVYPNPVKAGEAFTVAVAGKAAVSVYSLSGALVKQVVADGATAIATDGMQAGMYLVRIATDDGIHAAKLIVK